MAIMQSRRRFVTNAAVAGRCGFRRVGRWWTGRWRKIARRRAAAGNNHDPLRKRSGASASRLQVAEELLRAEGFTDIRYVELTEAHVRRRRPRMSASATN